MGAYADEVGNIGIVDVGKIRGSHPFIRRAKHNFWRLPKFVLHDGVIRPTPCALILIGEKIFPSTGVRRCCSENECWKLVIVIAFPHAIGDADLFEVVDAGDARCFTMTIRYGGKQHTRQDHDNHKDND